MQICRDYFPDCFAYSNGHCMALNDTRFDKPCPFYKKATEVGTYQEIAMQAVMQAKEDKKSIKY